MDIELVGQSTQADRDAAARRDAIVLGDDGAAAGVAAAAPAAKEPQISHPAIKTESDGGWTAEFQPLRQKPFDSREYERLHGLFFAERPKEAGARESRTRGGRLRVTTRVVGTTTRIAEWPRLRDTVQELHEAGGEKDKEEALRHLRCLERYMMLVRPGVLPRALRPDGAASGFADGEVVELLDSDEEQGAGPEVIDVEEFLLGPVRQARASIKREEPRGGKRRPQQTENGGPAKRARPSSAPKSTTEPTNVEPPSRASSAPVSPVSEDVPARAQAAAASGASAPQPDRRGEMQLAKVKSEIAKAAPAPAPSISATGAEGGGAAKRARPSSAPTSATDPPNDVLDLTSTPPFNEFGESPEEARKQKQKRKLSSAAARGDVVAIERLVSKGVNPNATVDGNPAVKVAARRGHAEAVSALARLGADVNATDDWGKTALVEATKKEHVQCVLELLKLGANRAARVWRGRLSGKTALDIVVDHSHNTPRAAECVALLRGASGAEAAQAAKDHELCNAAGTGDVAAIERLVPEGANPDVKGKVRGSGWHVATGPDGVPAVMIAAKAQHAKAVAALAHLGANLDATDNYGRTALMIAVDKEYWPWEYSRYTSIPHRPRGHAESVRATVRALLEGGADPNLQCTRRWMHRGETARMLAEKSGNAKLAALLQSPAEQAAFQAAQAEKRLAAQERKREKRERQQLADERYRRDPERKRRKQLALERKQQEEQQRERIRGWASEWAPGRIPKKQAK
eukprot:COSAG04_NODE_1700_length_5892_cov_2.003798_3_plen_746_part_00